MLVVVRDKNGEDISSTAMNWIAINLMKNWKRIYIHFYLEMCPAYSWAELKIDGLIALRNETLPREP